MRNRIEDRRAHTCAVTSSLVVYTDKFDWTLFVSLEICLRTKSWETHTPTCDIEGGSLTVYCDAPGATGDFWRLCAVEIGKVWFCGVM